MGGNLDCSYKCIDKDAGKDNKLMMLVGCFVEANYEADV
jgi:hypothetical protein